MHSAMVPNVTAWMFAGCHAWAGDLKNILSCAGTGEGRVAEAHSRAGLLKSCQWAAEKPMEASAQPASARLRRL